MPYKDREKRLAKQREHQARYREKNRERERARHREWYAANREEQQARGRSLYARDPEGLKAYSKQWREANPEKVKEQKRRAYQRKRTYGAAYLRCDPCSYCGGVGGEMDHIDPTVSGGANNWTNLTSACHSCNSQKYTSPLLHFLLRRLDGAQA